jgi:hypothetical protein
MNKASKPRAGGERDLSSFERRQLRVNVLARFGYGDREGFDMPNRYKRDGVRGTEWLVKHAPNTVDCWMCGAELRIPAEWHNVPTAEKNILSACSTYIQLDRIIPGSQGGKYRIDNVLPACGFCNKDRSDDHADENEMREYRAQFDNRYEG